MKCKLLYDMEAGPTASDDICTCENGKRFVLAGTVIDHPEAFLLVHAGHAESADEECTARVSEMDQSQSGKQREVHERIMREQSEFREEMEASELEEEEDEESE